MLAHELQVDPSLISRLRTGTRGVPHNREHIKVMSSYFARKCTTEYQRQALSGMLGIKLALTMKTEQLSEILYYWLCGDADEVGRFMRTFETFLVGEVDTSQKIESCDLKADNMAYYGKEGNVLRPGLFTSICCPWKNPVRFSSIRMNRTIGFLRILIFTIIFSSGVLLFCRGASGFVKSLLLPSLPTWPLNH